MEKGKNSSHTHYFVFDKKMLNSLYFLYYSTLKEGRSFFSVKGHEIYETGNGQQSILIGRWATDDEKKGRS